MEALPPPTDMRPRTYRQGFLQRHGPHLPGGGLCVAYTRTVTNQPTLNQPVLYTLSSHDAEQINRRRKHFHEYRQNAGLDTGHQGHVGNTVGEGDQFAAIVVRVFHTSANLRVFLDGNDDFWACSKSEGEGPNTYQQVGK
ncbi:hypothetical protein BJD78_gp11 [Arthrobacter phage KellEzio]|uniref:Uncharacterized protein n=1 Tax=Arthrobacter phage KellEzio TaxID=1796995 RepID=A0A140G696_9CAUD|nr:hypothetical protein BJD78_gp11 [Arthrobacter phage KellEzio]AMM44181.1 hypothetical protein KELLEZIO_11 [Arthrobacter phage KellEzio]